MLLNHFYCVLLLEIHIICAGKYGKLRNMIRLKNLQTNVNDIFYTFYFRYVKSDIERKIYMASYFLELFFSC